MNKLSVIFAKTSVFTVFLAASLALSCGTASAADLAVESTGVTPMQPGDAVASPWPVQFSDQGRTFLIYQPQVDKSENNRLEARSAVSVRDDATGRQNFGVVYFSARTVLDQGTSTLTVSDAVVSKAEFPALAGAAADDYVSALRTQFASQSWQIARERLQSDMEIDKYAQQAAKQPLKNDPPRILYSERAAVLVPVDGPPVLRAVADTGLMRITNTRALLLHDKATARYYLFVSDQWMAAQSLEGPWSVAVNPPAQLEQAKQVATQQDQVDLLEADAGDGTAPLAAMSVIVSTTPAELLQTEGAAQYSPIVGTQLLYVTNSPNKLFLDLRTQNHYALISGRWYRTTALDKGQWNYVPAADLPADFAMIPAEHPTESVRAAVPGTPQAREAVIENSIPQVATVARTAAKLDVAYDGDPVFQPIEGTVLQNAVNSPVPVIRVNEGSFYALDNGVWFVATSPFGPWTVTGYVPPVIYSIPRSSPLYYVTYVRVYDSTPEVVYVGYTPGYVGSYVSSDNVVVYGTGWPYRPWIGSVWYGAPVTWGFGFSFVYSWWNPFPWYSYHRVGWARPYPYYYHPGWGPWHARGYGHHGFGAAVGAGVRPDGSGPHNVGRIYDRWDRGGLVWNGPRAIANQRRSGGPALAHARPDSGFVAGGDNRWRRLGDDGHRDRGRRDDQFRANPANSPRADRTPSAVQTPWRRAPGANQNDRAPGTNHNEWRHGPSPSVGGNDRRPEARQSPQRERVLEQPQGNGAPRGRADGPSHAERPGADFQWKKPQAMPHEQAPQRMPPVAGVPVDRAPSQPQRAMPQRNFSAPAARSNPPAASIGGRSFERPSVNPGRIERPAAASGGRNFERPSMTPGRNVERSAGRPQFRDNGNGGHAQPNEGGGGHRNGALRWN